MSIKDDDGKKHPLADDDWSVVQDVWDALTRHRRTTVEEEGRHEPRNLDDRIDDVIALGLGVFAGAVLYLAVKNLQNKDRTIPNVPPLPRGTPMVRTIDVRSSSNVKYTNPVLDPSLPWPGHLRSPVRELGEPHQPATVGYYGLVIRPGDRTISGLTGAQMMAQDVHKFAYLFASMIERRSFYLDLPTIETTSTVQQLVDALDMTNVDVPGVGLVTLRAVGLVKEDAGVAPRILLPSHL